ncbi:periplasmic binding protein-like I [Obelidium mucronatum]|nr:periplasmic binding protein-like I [Obelidium mucronatum]
MNITLAFVSNYCFFPEVVVNSALVENYTITPEISTNQVDLASANVYYNDIAMLAAVQLINESQDILPGVMVNVRRFTDCGAYFPGAVDEYNGYSGGYAGSIMSQDIGVVYTDVLGVIGNEYSTTARNAAGALSNYKIPYCSSGSSSPRLSNKEKYPYFWRPLPAKGLGNHICQFLKSWNVNRVALIFENNDDLGVQFGNDIKQAILSHTMTLSSHVGIPGTFDSTNVEYIKLQILQSDSRYILLSGQNAFVSQLYYALARLGLVGPEYVYISYNSPVLLDSQVSDYEFNVYDAIQGFIQFQQMPPRLDTAIFSEFYNRVLEIAGVSSDILSAATLIDNTNIGASPAFDCVYVMLKGFDNLLKKGNYTIEMLADRQLQEHLNYTLFQNVGFSGLDADPVEFNQYGDLLVSYQVSYFNGDYYNMTDFGFTNANATAFTQLNNTVVFYGGATTPPMDGPLLQSRSIYSLKTEQPGTLIALGTTGSILSMMALLFVFAFRKNQEIKSLGIDYTSISIFGTLISFSSMFNELLFPISPFHCHSRVWILLMGYCVTLTPLLIKNLYVWIIFSATEDLPISAIALRLYALNALAICIEVGLLIAWSFTTRQSLIRINTTGSKYDVLICQSVLTVGGHSNSSKSNSTIVTLLYAYNLLLICSCIPLISMTRNIHSRYNESTVLLCLLLLFVLTFAVLVTLPMNSDHLNDLRRCVCVWVLAVLVLSLVVGSRVVNLRNELVDTKNLANIRWSITVGRRSISGNQSERNSKIRRDSSSQRQSVGQRESKSGPNHGRKIEGKKLKVLKFCRIAHSLYIAKALIKAMNSSEWQVFQKERIFRRDF